MGYFTAAGRLAACIYLRARTDKPRNTRRGLDRPCLSPARVLETGAAVPYADAPQPHLRRLCCIGHRILGVVAKATGEPWPQFHGHAGGVLVAALAVSSFDTFEMGGDATQQNALGKM